MRVITYWETPKNVNQIHPWIPLSLAIMKKQLGNKFLLLTKYNLKDYLSDIYLEKNYNFNQLPFKADPEHLRLVAKSDVIRYAFINEHGGIYLDADTILLDNNFNLFLDNLIQTDKLYWGNEVFFGAKPSNKTVSKILDNIMKNDTYDWGNPGNKAAIVNEENKDIIFLPSSYYEPHYHIKYNFEHCKLMFDKTISPKDFLINHDVKMLKLYNTYFSRKADRVQSVKEFLDSEYLMAKLFLQIAPKEELIQSSENILDFIL
ncbi:TPA: hypothetical protein QB288_000180 [Pasteurella multocida]|nr:hypothetical protein [Pasteurella multocida]